jgi:hypothetical protein
VAGESIAPDGVRYSVATEATNSIASDKLRAAFDGPEVSISDLVSLGVQKNAKVLLGTYLAQTVSNNRAYRKGSLTAFAYKMTLDKYPIAIPGLAATTAEEAREFSELFVRMYSPHATFAIRKLTKEEMALIWFYIGWDIIEPIYVVELGGRKLVFDFGPDGTYLEWIEDITEPCFRLATERAGTPCFCSIVVSKQNQYRVMFEPRDKCLK